MPEIELAGGERDGQRMSVPDLRLTYRFPPAPRPPTLASFSEEELPPDPLVYERAGIRDDGTRWYRLRG